MKKLKLESLEVTSFETLSDSRDRGTVQGHAEIIFPGGDLTTGVDSTNPYICWYETNAHLDCTYGCSQFTGCEGHCGPSLIEP